MSLQKKIKEYNSILKSPNSTKKKKNTKQEKKSGRQIINDYFNKNSTGISDGAFSTASDGKGGRQIIRDYFKKMGIDITKSYPRNTTNSGANTVATPTSFYDDTLNEGNPFEANRYKQFTQQRAEKIHSQKESTPEDFGTYGKGNINLYNRPVYKNSDGTISTVESISFSEDGKEILVPSIVYDGHKKARKLTPEQAIEHYRKTGEYLGKFDTVEEADDYAERLHFAQEKLYGDKAGAGHSKSDTERRDATTAMSEIENAEDAAMGFDFEQFKTEKDNENKKADLKKRENLDAICKKYGINPTTFSVEDFEKWATDHGFEQRYTEGLTREYKWLPKSKGLFSVVPTKEERSDQKMLEELAHNNARKEKAQTDAGAGEAALQGLASETFLGATKAVADKVTKSNYKRAGLPMDEYVSPSEANAKTMTAHPIATEIGAAVPSLVELVAVGNVVEEGAKGVKWLSKAPRWIQSAVKSGITFAAVDGTKSTFDGKNAKEILKDSARGAAGGAAGGALSGMVGSLGSKVLNNKALRHKVIPQIINAGLSGAAFAGGSTAATYFLYPEDQRPSKEQIVQNVGIAFAFASIMNGIDIMSTSAKNKKILDNLVEKMSADYEKMASSSVHSSADISGKRILAQEVSDYADIMEAFFNGESISKTINGTVYEFEPNDVRFVGQSKRVKEIIEELNTIRAGAADYLQRTDPGKAIAKTDFKSPGIVPFTGNPTVSAEANRVSELVDRAFVKAFSNVGNADVVHNVNDIAVNTGKLDSNFLRAYTNAAEESLAKSNSLAYKELSSTGENISDTLFNHLTTGKENAMTQLPIYDKLEKRFLPIVSGAVDDINSIYQDVNPVNDNFNRKVEAVRRGDFGVLANVPEQPGTNAPTVKENLTTATENITQPVTGMNVQNMHVSEDAASESVTKPITKAEMKLLKRDDEKLPMTLDIDGNKYVSNGFFVIRTDDSGINAIKENITKGNELPTMQSGIIEKFLSGSSLGTVKGWHTNESNNTMVCVVDDKAFSFNPDFVKMIQKRSDTMKIISGGSLGTTVLAGYDKNKKLVGISLPVMSEGSFKLNGFKVPFATDESLQAYRNLPKEKQEIVSKYEGKEFTDGKKRYRVKYDNKLDKFLFAEIQPDGTAKNGGARLMNANDEDMQEFISSLAEQAKETRAAEERKKKNEENQKIAEAQKAEKEKYVNAYVKDKPTMQQGKIRQTLLKTFNFEGYGFITRAEFIEKNVREGNKIVFEKDEYRVMKPDKTFWKITKTEYDYAKFLEGVLNNSKNSSGIAKEIDVDALFGAINKAKPGDEIKLSDYEKKDENVLNNPQNSDIMNPETKPADKEDKESEPRQSILAEESKPDGGGLRSGTGGDTVEEGTEGSNGPHRGNGGNGISESTGDAAGRSDVGDAGKGVHGGLDAENASAETGRVAERSGGRGELHGGGNGTVSGVGGQLERLTNKPAPETIDTVDKAVEQKRPSNKDNFVITNDMASELDTTQPSAKDNIEAIEMLLKLENEGRAATADEKKVLAGYKGWGGIDTRYLPYELRTRLNQLYDWRQLQDMESSQNNAFFTPTKVIDAMYNGLKRMGFRGGNILETSMGVGNFFGRMPSGIRANSALTGVELESYTARIAQYLYPGATVINKPFQDVVIKNGSYDLVIGNVPFGQNKISYNKKRYSLHNYFIISALDDLKDGGILAVITSAGTLDNYAVDARSAIMDRADVIACYKLPEKVFSRNANTDVQTDMLILRKRESGARPRGDSILNVTTTSDGLRLNEYFVKHPENILGSLEKGTNAYGEITTVKDDGNFYKELDAAMKKLPKDIVSGETELKPVETIVTTESRPRYLEKDGRVYADDGAGTATLVPKSQESTARDFMRVRDAYKNLLDAYSMDLPESEIKPLRDELSKVYGTFVLKHGPITGDGTKKIGNARSKNNTFLEADSDYYLVSGLEKYDKKNAKFEKSALFEKDTLRRKKVTSVDTASDALAISLNESGGINFKRMTELTGKSEKQIADELKGEIVLTPEGDYVLTDIYLSGNIYDKLDAVEGKPEFKEQRKMLEEVIPTPKRASDITVKLGANYIDTKYIEQFAREVLQSGLTIRKDTTGRWVIEGVRKSRYGHVVNVKYGCDAMNAVQLLEKILNDGEISITKKVGTGSTAVTVFDAEMTDIAKQKADDIRQAFNDWIFKDSKRRADIENKYNRMYNNYRPLDYARIADKLSFDSMDISLKNKLYPHQKKGIARFLFGGNVLFAHGVGTGKTFEMIASVMEAKRMGLVNKTAMVVPNNKVVDFKRDILQAYPDAKVLVIDTAKKKRQSMLALINSNDWDIVLVARTTFTMIPVSKETLSNYTKQQLEDINRQIADARHDPSVSKRQLKGLVTQKDNLEQKLKDINAETKRDSDSVEFEKLGIDCICVDEAHNYKSILTPSKLDIKGLVNRNNAQLANDMLMKLDYLRSRNGRIVFGTGTPITNTVSEIYNMMRMVRPDILEDAGIHSLDEWVNTFANIESNTEIGIDGQIKKKATQTIRNFVNASEMIGMFKQFADIVFTEDVVKNLPKAKYIDVKLEGTPEHKHIQEQIIGVLTKASKQDRLKLYGKVMAMADAASVDLRMLSGADTDVNDFKDYSAEELEYENSKINKMCDIVLDEYKQSQKIKGTQIIFCDKGAGSGTVYDFNLHKDIMQKLIERGIPKDEIVIIKNQSDAQLEDLYEKVNNGDVRVLIGTSAKMAEGLNVQERVVAIHHPTVTYKPSDWEQGNARGVRAGNINDEVRIYRYLQENTFDSHKWQAQDRKSEMIRNALRGDAISELEDIGADDEGGAEVDAATAMAITSGNPLVKKKIDIDKEVARLRAVERNYKSELYRYQDVIAKNPGLIEQTTEFVRKLEADISLKSKYGEKPEITISGKKYDKQNEANMALAAAVKTAPKNGQFTKVGTYNGFDILFKGDTGGMDYSLAVKGANTYAVEYAGAGNNIARIGGVLNRFDSELERLQARIKLLKSDLEFAKGEVNKPFEKAQELKDALEQQKDITYQYEHYGKKPKADSTEKSETVHSSRTLAVNDGKAYTYKALTSKKNMHITALGKENLYTADGKLDRADIVDKGIKNVRQKSNPQNTDKNSFVYVADVGRSVLVTKDGLRHGLSRNSEATARVTCNIGDVLENAIMVNELNPRKTTVGGYVLLGVAADFDNKDYPKYYPVRIVVNQFSGIEDIEALDVLYAIKARRTSLQKEQGFVDNSTPLIKGSSDISIADLLDLVKNDFSDILSDDVLRHFGVARAKSSLSDDVKYSKDVADERTAQWTTVRDGESTDGKKSKTEAVNIAGIVEKIRKHFNIPISGGKVTDPQAAGIYKERPETIRTRVVNDLPTISHELGHHLDKKYVLSNMPSVKELRKNISGDFLSEYKETERDAESIAEFVREYLRNKNEAYNLCPEFYNDFVRTLSKEDLQAVDGLASDINTYFSYGASERYDASIVSSKEKNKEPFRAKWSKIYTDWVDEYHPQKTAMDYVEEISGKDFGGRKNAYVLATNSRNAHTIANYLVTEGFRDLEGNIVNAKSFMDCISMVDSKNINLLDKYLVLRHSLEWIEPVHRDVTKKRVFADETLENADTIKKLIAEIEKEHPEIKIAAENLYEYQNNLLKYFVVPAGGMTKETANRLQKMYPSYVPFYRAKGNRTGKKSGSRAKGAFANQHSPIMRAKGSGALIVSPTESIIQNTEKMVKFALRNQVMQLWADYADTVEGFGQYMEKVAPDMIPHVVDISRQKDKFTDALMFAVNSGEDYFAVSNLFDEFFGDTVTGFTPVANANKKIVTVMRGGKASYYQIHDDAFYKSVAESTPQQLEGMLKVINSVMQPMKLLITQNNPIFAFTNAIRDFATAYKLSPEANPAKFTTQYLAALREILSKGDMYKQFKAMGGGHASELTANVENISKTIRLVALKDEGLAKRLAVAIFIHPVETVAMFNDAVESVPRLAEFIRTLNAGGDLQQAIYNADDITTNFKRRGAGATSKVVDKVILFNNAGKQGIDKTFRTLLNKNPKERAKTIAKWVVHALLFGIMGYVYNKIVDEEGYENLSSYKKNNFYNIAIGDGKFISIPKARENAIFDSLVERVLDIMGGKDDAFYQFGEYLTLHLLPNMIPGTLNPVNALHDVLGNTIIGGFTDIGFNKDFKGTPIESKRDEYLPAKERYTENTSMPAYLLGQTKIAGKLNLSPKKIDHLISSYTGIVGQVNKALFSKNSKMRDYSIGLRNKFISDSNYSTDVLNKVYDNKDKAKLAFEYDMTAKKGMEYEKNAVMADYISEMNKAIKALPDDDQRNGRAYLLHTLKRWKYENTDVQNDMLQRLKKESVNEKCFITELPSSKFEWTEDKVKHSYQMTPQEYNEYITEYLNLVDIARKAKSNITSDNYISSLETVGTEAKKALNKKYKPKFVIKASQK